MRVSGVLEVPGVLEGRVTEEEVTRIKVFLQFLSFVPRSLRPPALRYSVGQVRGRNGLVRAFAVPHNIDDPPAVAVVQKLDAVDTT